MLSVISDAQAIPIHERKTVVRLPHCRWCGSLCISGSIYDEIKKNSGLCRNSKDYGVHDQFMGITGVKITFVAYSIPSVPR